MCEYAIPMRCSSELCRLTRRPTNDNDKARVTGQSYCLIAVRSWRGLFTTSCRQSVQSDGVWTADELLHRRRPAGCGERAMAKRKHYDVLVTLQDGDNDTYSATFLLELPDSPSLGNSSSSSERDDYHHAGYYVASVFLLYGLSIAFLIASTIRRSRFKEMQDHQIDKYLREFQVRATIYYSVVHQKNNAFFFSIVR